MKKYYVTYGCGTNLKNCYTEIDAIDYEDARNIVFTEIGPAFAFMYDERGFAGQVEKYNLREVPLQAMEEVE